MRSPRHGAHTCDCSDASCGGERNPLRLLAVRKRKNVPAPPNVSAYLMRASTLLNGSLSQRRPEIALADHGLQGRQELAGAERVSLERLQLAVAELFKAVSNALQDERESAEECIRRASAILRVDLPGAISGVAIPPPSAAPPKPIRGG